MEMVKIKLKDGSIREVEKGTTVYDVAAAKIGRAHV